MLDVVFILLTFFIFAMVLSKRFTVTDIRLPQSGPAASGSPAQSEMIVVSLRQDGTVLLGEQTLAMEALPERLAQVQRERPAARLFLAPDTGVPSGDLFRLMDTLARAGVRDLRFLRTDGVAKPQ